VNEFTREEPKDASEPSGLTELLVQLGDVARSRLGESLAAHGLTPAKVRALRMIEQRSGLSQAALAWRLGIATSRVAKLVRELEEQGLIARPRRGTDQRRSEMRLTSDGVARLAAARDTTRHVDDALASNLTASERQAAQLLLGKLMTPPT
jgi:DNA-binding MarR family transcriptional regulator